MAQCQRWTVSLLALSVWLTTDSAALAARLLKATVQVDGQTVLNSTYQDDDFWGAPPAAAVWRYLAREPIWVEEGTRVQADASKPLQAKLRGEINVRVQHVDRLIVEAKATELILIRTDAASDKWFLPAEEVERLAQANGIPGAPSQTLFEPATMLAMACAAVVLILILVVGTSIWLLIRRRRRPTSASSRVDR